MSPQQKRNLLRHAEDFACAVLIIIMIAAVMGIEAMVAVPVAVQ